MTEHSLSKKHKNVVRFVYRDPKTVQALENTGDLWSNNYAFDAVPALAQTRS
jgi:hypothetical protein